MCARATVQTEAEPSEEHKSADKRSVWVTLSVSTASLGGEERILNLFGLKPQRFLLPCRRFNGSDLQLQQGRRVSGRLALHSASGRGLGDKLLQSALWFTRLRDQRQSGSRRSWWRRTRWLRGHRLQPRSNQAAGWVPRPLLSEPKLVWSHLPDMRGQEVNVVLLLYLDSLALKTDP